MVLWKGGISFGGVVAFIFADLIIAPILNIYRKYYGRRMAAFLLGTFFAAMAVAGYVVELVFGGLGLVPSPATAKIPDQGVSWDYTTWLNIVFLILAAALIIRFTRTGGPAMLRMMGGQPPAADILTPSAATCTTACPTRVPGPRPSKTATRPPRRRPTPAPSGAPPTHSCSLRHARPRQHPCFRRIHLILLSLLTIASAYLSVLTIRFRQIGHQSGQNRYEDEKMVRTDRKLNVACEKTALGQP